MPRYGHKSEPHTHVAEIRMMASVGLSILGASRSSKRTSRGPYSTVPRMFSLLLFSAAGDSETGHLQAGHFLQTFWIATTCDRDLRRLAHEFFVGEWTIYLGGVEKRDPTLDSCVEKLDHLLLVLGRAIGKAHSHAAEPDGLNFQIPVSQFALLHCSSFDSLSVFISFALDPLTGFIHFSNLLVVHKFRRPHHPSTLAGYANLLARRANGLGVEKANLAAVRSSPKYHSIKNSNLTSAPALVASARFPRISSVQSNYEFRGIADFTLWFSLCQNVRIKWILAQLWLSRPDELWNET